jgi:hypothetical protein
MWRGDGRERHATVGQQGVVGGDSYGGVLAWKCPIGTAGCDGREHPKDSSAVYGRHMLLPSLPPSFDAATASLAKATVLQSCLPVLSASAVKNGFSRALQHRLPSVPSAQG